MAMCNWCKSEMLDRETETCHANTYVEFNDDDLLKSVPYTSQSLSGRCHDCNIADGGKHHPGCDMERCPKCKGQLISCGCLDDEASDSD